LLPDRPDDGGSKDPWNAGKLLPDYTALQPRRQPSSYSPPREPQILPSLYGFISKRLHRILETVVCGSCNPRLARCFGFLWAASEASPNTVHSCIRHRGPTRTLVFANAPFLLEFLLPDVNVYSAVWFHVKLCAKCTLHSCYRLFLR
jgi:hypothetical protein